jgi:hypothetical protein
MWTGCSVCGGVSGGSSSSLCGLFMETVSRFVGSRRTWNINIHPNIRFSVADLGILCPTVVAVVVIM